MSICNGLRSSIRYYGVQFKSERLSPEANDISLHVVNKTLESYRKAIRNSVQYQEYQSGKKQLFVGPLPEKDVKCVREYLISHSIRQGVLGKLASLVNRILEFINNLSQGFSQKSRALDELEELVVQSRRLAGLSSNKKPVSSHEEAKNLLKAMLADYNKYCN